MANQVEHKYTNQLIHEKSPYLLQHAHNPVNWHPWGEEAIEKARAEDKPILLSIGYSTCHWCHVMEEESFENEEIAKLMNEYFIPIKLDREERPDIDQIYMQAVQTMTGSGGWPLNVFLTPELKPFYGGTYFPPEDRWGRPGFITVLEGIHKRWSEEKETIINAAGQMTNAMNRPDFDAEQSYAWDKSILKQAVLEEKRSFDSTYGGFSPAPKFPRTHNISFLLRQAQRDHDEELLGMIYKTLDEMGYGGIYDHLGGGFHRYSVDEYWHIPHFEKMLYDQALISKTYLEAYQVAKNPRYAKIVRQTFEYVLRDMLDPQTGAFYSAEDADSFDEHGEKKEGAFYVWEKSEIENILGEDAKVFIEAFGVLENGNARQDPHQEFTHKNILFLDKTEKELAEIFGKEGAEIKMILRGAKQKLFDIREKRKRPHLDDKILTDWNSLMISSFAFGGRVLSKDIYIEKAEKAMSFLLETMVRKSDQRLMHRYREGEVAVEGFLDDYAFFLDALIELYLSTFKPIYLEKAKFFASELMRLFEDPEKGGYFMASEDIPYLISRNKEIYDGAIPSGNSVAMYNLVRLSRLLIESDFEASSERALNHFYNTIVRRPSGFPISLIAVDFVLGPSYEVVLVAPKEDEVLKKKLSFLNDHFLPRHLTVLKVPEYEIGKLISHIDRYETLSEETTAYICQNYICKLPTNDFEKFKTLIIGEKES